MQQEIVRLQQFLNMKGYHQPITGYFGTITKGNLTKYESEHDMSPTALPTDLQSTVMSDDDLDSWCMAIQSREGFFAPGENVSYPEGTPSYRNNNPGNCVWEGQTNAVQNGRFAKFNTYQDGFNYLKNLLIWACTGQTSLYNPNGTLVDFYKVYAPSSDGNDPESYAKEVAGKLGVDPECVIKTLLP